MTPRQKAIRRLQNLVDKRWEPMGKRHGVDYEELDKSFEEFAREAMGRHAYSWACRESQVRSKSIEYALKVLKEASE